MRQKIVGVMGSGDESHQDRARPLGNWLAGLGVHLLTGGGGGIMTAVSEAFFRVSDRTGSVIAVLPSGLDRIRPPLGYPNPWVEIAIRTHLPFSGSRGTDSESRNHINILSSDVIVALPGGSGTSSEVRLALLYEKPLIGFLRDRTEIPDLPPEVPIGDFEAVQEFVLRILD